MGWPEVLISFSVTLSHSVQGTELSVGGQFYEPGSVYLQPKLYQSQLGRPTSLATAQIQTLVCCMGSPQKVPLHHRAKHRVKNRPWSYEIMDLLLVFSVISWTGFSIRNWFSDKELKVTNFEATLGGRQKAVCYSIC